MKKSSVVLIVVIVVVILGAFAFWVIRDNTSQPETNGDSGSSLNGGSGSDGDDPVSNPVVTYDGLVFSPDSITIKSGDTVTFINESDSEVWPASDDHPTHTNLSGFDPQRGLEPGEEFSFTFEEAGEWGYHNHLEPGQTGVVTVE